MSRSALGPTQPPSSWVITPLDTRLKRPEHEEEHSPPSSAVAKTNWSYISTVPYALTTWCITTRQKGFDFYNISKVDHCAKHSVCDKKNINIILTYLLTSWSRVLHEKLTGSAASQEIPRISGTRRFITVLTSARHFSLSW